MTRALSPRPRVRVAAADAAGDALNCYVEQCAVDGPAPARPWALYLAAGGRFRLLAFDLDTAKAGPGGVARDVEVLAGLLEHAGIPHMVCQSGPSGGRHVWTALAESVDAATVATLARLTAALCPSLDTAPLTNAATGCVRPPGAPHRHGGRSQVLAGDLDVLTRPTVTAAQVRALVEHLAALVDAAAAAATGGANAGGALVVDEHGHPHLPGPRRPLPPASAAALQEDAACGDASAVLWRVLIGAAAARWRHADLAELVATAPGLEHVRSRRDRASRSARPLNGPDSPTADLRRQWQRATHYAAAARRDHRGDPTFDQRADELAAHVRTLQDRADAAAGRWGRGGGPADRRVLDALCVLALQALTVELEADVRRLALLTGIGRETARTALHRLAADGWISHARPAEGPRAAHWKIEHLSVVHRDDDLARSQADPRPAGAGAGERTALLTVLTRRLDDAGHDLFTASPALGLYAGAVYAHAQQLPQPVDVLARCAGGDPKTTERTLRRLGDAGALVVTSSGWARPRTDRRSAAAAVLGVHGRLADRAQRYAVERHLWAWWQAERVWMTAARRTDAARRAGPGQLLLLPDVGTNALGAHPRRANGRADYAAARRLIDASADRGRGPARRRRSAA